MVLGGLAKTLCFETNMLTIFEMNTYTFISNFEEKREILFCFITIFLHVGILIQDMYATALMLIKILASSMHVESSCRGAAVQPGSLASAA